MKNYMNSKERDVFVLILAFEEYLKIFGTFECLSEKEKKNVDNAVKNLSALNQSIKDRMGLIFLKKLKSFLDNNTLNFHAKGIKRDLVISQIDDDIVNELLEEAGWSMDCLDCEKEDYIDCRCYKIFVEMGKEGNGKKDGCPFK